MGACRRSAWCDKRCVDATREKHTAQGSSDINVFLRDLQPRHNEAGDAVSDGSNATVMRYALITP